MRVLGAHSARRAALREGPPYGQKRPRNLLHFQRSANAFGQFTNLEWVEQLHTLYALTTSSAIPELNLGSDDGTCGAGSTPPEPMLTLEVYDIVKKMLSHSLDAPNSKKKVQKTNLSD